MSHFLTFHTNDDFFQEAVLGAPWDISRQASSTPHPLNKREITPQRLLGKCPWPRHILPSYLAARNALISSTRIQNSQSFRCTQGRACKNGKGVMKAHQVDSNP